MLQGFEGTPAALLADGRPLAARFAGGDEGFIVQADPGELVGALRNARALEVRGADGARLGLVSLAGASAAMLYMDERQRRIGTVTALVRTGPQPASAVPAPPALPQVRIAAAPTDRPLAIDAATVARLRRQFGCEEYDVRGPEEFEAEQIETGKTLILVPCGSGAYNFSSVPVIAQRAAAASPRWLRHSTASGGSRPKAGRSWSTAPGIRRPGGSTNIARRAASAIADPAPNMPGTARASA